MTAFLRLSFICILALEKHGRPCTFLATVVPVRTDLDPMSFNPFLPESQEGREGDLLCHCSLQPWGSLVPSPLPSPQHCAP